MSSWGSSDEDGPQWWWSDYHRAQYAAKSIPDLQDSVRLAQGDAARLRRQLSEVQSDLEIKVNRLGVAFDAFVELSDLRAALAADGDAAVARHRVRQMLAAITAGQPPVALKLPDVDGYWLVPAARALHARLTGDGAAAGGYAAAATELDAARCAYFLAGATRLAGPAELDDAQLATVLPAPSDPNVSRAQRLCWLATAAGAFGSSGRARLVAVLRTALGNPADGETLPEPWAKSVGDAGTGAGAAADRLVALRQTCTEPEPDVAAVDTPAAPSPMLVPLRELVGCLVDEGAESERAALRRIEELRAVIANGTAPPAYRPWDEPAGPVADVVYADIVGDPAPPGARPVAVAAAAPWLQAVAQHIAERGRRSEPPVLTVRPGYGVNGIDVTSDGPDLAALRAARAGIEQSYQPRGLWQKLFGAAKLREAQAEELKRVETQTNRAIEQSRERDKTEAEQRSRLAAELDATSQSLTGIRAHSSEERFPT